MNKTAIWSVLLFVGMAALCEEVPDEKKDYFSLEEALKNPERVYRLELKDKGLTEVPPEIGKLTNLKWLVLSVNQLKRLPPEIGNLQNVEYLSLHRNELTELPAEIGKMTGVKILRVFNNRLTSLPPEIGLLRNLEELDVSRNRGLTQLPDELGQLENLRKLVLNQTALESLPGPLLAKLKNLRELQAESMSPKLKSIPGEIATMKDLEELHLMNNQIEELPVEVIVPLVRLKKLTLCYNRLSRIPPEIGQLTNLTDIRLHQNNLCMIPVEMARLTNLVALSLFSNPIVGLPMEMKGLSRLKEVYLGEWGGTTKVHVPGDQQAYESEEVNWQEQRQGSPDLECEVRVGMNRDMIVAEVVRANIPTAEVEMVVVSDGTNMPSEGCITLPEGEHDVQVLCRSKKSPLFYRICFSGRLRSVIPTGEEIGAWIRKLGAEKHAEREEAQLELRAMGETAIPHLQKATHDADPEVRERARELLRARRDEPHAGDKAKEDDAPPGEPTRQQLDRIRRMMMRQQRR